LFLLSNESIFSQSEKIVQIERNTKENRIYCIHFLKIIRVLLAFQRLFLYLCIWKGYRSICLGQRQKPQGLSLLAAAARYSHARHKILPRSPQQFATGGAN
jgi:hypothetical protein